MLQHQTVLLPSSPLNDLHQAQCMRPLRDPRDLLVYSPSQERQELIERLQAALNIEMTTIPPYLCAMYSVSDNTSDAYTTLRSVVMEEMLHLMQVSNLINALGGKPQLTDPKVLPTYPGFIKGLPGGGPYIQLMPLSQALARSVFMVIEQPEPDVKSPTPGNKIDSIGQFYKSIASDLEQLVKQQGEKELFGQDTGLQRTDFYLGVGGGDLRKVNDLESAQLALCTIIDQGEGADVPDAPKPGEEPFGGLDYYGTRPDGTYGPIIGTPWELSHYRKFAALADGTMPIPTIYPMIANPRAEDFAGTTRELADLFNACYSLTLTALEGAMTTPEVDTSFYGVAFPCMRVVLPSLAVLLMQTPINPAVDPLLGPNAGPPFQYVPQPLDAIIELIVRLRSTLPNQSQTYRQLWEEVLQIAITTLTRSQQHARTANLPL